MMQHNPEDYKMELASYRVSIAKEDLDTAKEAFLSSKYRLANNRAYYAIFHAITAVYAIDGHTYKKHKDAIGNFNRYYIHTGIFPKDFAARITQAEIIRHQSDYDDFYIASKEKTFIQLETASQLISLVEEYLSIS